MQATYGLRINRYSM